jgi:hypothetical protein
VGGGSLPPSYLKYELMTGYTFLAEESVKNIEMLIDPNRQTSRIV